MCQQMPPVKFCFPLLILKPARLALEWSMTSTSIRRATNIRMKEMAAERTRRIRLEKLFPPGREKKPVNCRDFRGKIKEAQM